MSSRVWKLNRLRAMGAAEILWRVRQALHVRLERRGWGLAMRPPAPDISFGLPWCDPLPHDFDAMPYVAAANRVLSGRYDVFALRDAAVGFPPEWNRDPRTGARAPIVFGKTLDYREEGSVGNIKYLWEPNRHLELVTLAQAFHLTGEVKYADACRSLLDSWFTQCPYPLGPNWTSSLEHAVRLVNWAVAWNLMASSLIRLSPTGGEGVLMGGDGEAFRRRWLNSIYQHCHFVAGHFSKYSSANNHLFGEYMGLFVAAVTWPCWRESARWRDLAKSGLEKEAVSQNAPDGVNREQATWYHHEVADMMLLCGLIGRANSIEFSGEYWARLEAMLEFVASIMDVAGNVPMMGDSDDGVMVRLDPGDRPNVFRSQLATGAVLFGRGDFKAKSASFDDKSRWLLGDAAAREYETLASVVAAPRREFAEGGYCILGDGFGTVREVRMVADAGALGYLSIAAHGHADALAFTLSVGGQEILIDPGTYAYHTEKGWRNYFRGTSAHNTVRVDGRNQSEIAGNFLWLDHAWARLEHFESGPERDVWRASHDGYLRLADPVQHRREIVFDKDERKVRVTDSLECHSEHEVEIHWHFAEDCTVVLESDRVIARKKGVALVLAMTEGRFVPELVSGRENPPLGWVSRSFDQKQASFTAVWRGAIRGTSRLVTEARF